MEPFRRAFIRFLLECEALRFGDFTTKSGRKSPYFINTGMIRTGMQLARMGDFYAHTIEHHFGDSVDNLYGPAYKGIPLAVASAAALHRLYNRDFGVSFNRKEAKDHGEGGTIVGSRPLDGMKIAIVEDVVTAGTAVRESLALLHGVADVTVTALFVSVDRMEKGTGELSALDELRETLGIRVYPIITVRDIIAAMPEGDWRISAMEGYLKQYGAVK